MVDQPDPSAMGALQQVYPRMPPGNPSDPPLLRWPPGPQTPQARPSIPGNPNDPPLLRWPPAPPTPPPQFIQVPVPLWERVMNTIFGPRTPIGTVEQTRRVRVPDPSESQQ